MASCYNKKRSLLDLQLSSTSFLEAIATDTGSDKPLYAVETVGSFTTVWRSDPWDGTAKIADIRWPKELPLKGKGKDNAQTATILMDGLRWRETSSLLKHSGLGRWVIISRPALARLLTALSCASSRKFYVPYHPHALKWKREANVYVVRVLPPEYAQSLTVIL